MASDPASAYSFTQLADPYSQIRLLKIPLNIQLFMGLPSLSPLTATLAPYDIPVGSLSRARRLLRASRLPLFFALSYVWGTPEKSHEIWIDGKRFPITRNLYLALRSMQSNDTGTMHVWADAICINQEDNAEKSAQIHLMREIYHTASEVQVWLGLATPETKRCLNFMNKLTESSDEVLDDLAEMEDDQPEDAFDRAFIPPVTAFIRGGFRFGQGVIDFGEIFASPSARDDKTEVISPVGELSLHQNSLHISNKWRPSELGLKAAEEIEGDFIEVAKLIDKHITQHLWFTRMWVVQEMCCARSCNVRIGRNTIDWELFVNILNYLHFHRRAELDNIRKIIGLEIIRRGWTHSKRQSLKDLIRETRFREATDPRDKIYSLYGLMGDRMNEYLKPDYSLSVAEIYSSTSRHFITQSKSLDSLLGWQNIPHPSENGVPDLPSWVPDYSLHQSYTPTALVSIDGRESIYCASGCDHRANYLLPLDKMQPPLGLTGWSTLRVSGICIDTILSLSTFPIAPHLSSEGELNLGLVEKTWLSTLLKAVPLQRQLTTEVRALLSYISDVVSFYSSIHNQQQSHPPRDDFSGWISLPLPLPLQPNPQTDPSELLSILLDDLEKPGDNSLPVAYLQALLSGRMSSHERTTKDTLRQFLVSPYTSPTLHAETPQLLDEREFLQKATQALASSLIYRSLAITQQGHLVTVPVSTQPGDIAAVLYGASVVCILRMKKHAADANYLAFQPSEKKLFEKQIEDEVEEEKRATDATRKEHALIGEAYLHGFMDAEGIAMCVRGQLKESDFLLS